MERNKAVSIGIVGMAIAMACGSSAMATSWNLTFTSLGPASTIGINYDNNRTWSDGAVNTFSNTSAGELRWQNQQGQTFATYCTQIGEHISYNQNATFEQVAVEQVPDSPPSPGPMGLAKATVLRDLYARFWAQTQSSASNVQNAAFQAVIWEITHENTVALTAAGILAQLNLSQGAMQLSNSGNTNNSVFSAASAMLAQLGGANQNDFWGFGTPDTFFGLTHETLQDQLIVIPIPAPALLAGLGLLGLGALRRRLK